MATNTRQALEEAGVADKAIYSAKKFVERITPGTQFWIIGTICSKPQHLQGPYTLQYLLYGEEDKITYHYAGGFGFVSDAVQDIHGVFTNHEDACDALRIAQAKYKESKEWQRLVQGTSERMKHFAPELSMPVLMD